MLIIRDVVIGGICSPFLEAFVCRGWGIIDYVLDIIFDLQYFITLILLNYNCF